jgi:hypothetical protein
MYFRILFYPIILLLFPILLGAQQTTRVATEQCATMQRLELRLARHPQLKAKFEQERLAFTNALKSSNFRQLEADSSTKTVYTIPVVFHIVTGNPGNISDATILAQLDVLNKAFAGTNADTTRIPTYFKPLFGRSAIQFCLAQRTPIGEGTSGIERIKTTQTSFTSDNDAVKHASTGGADSWDTKKYYNVWICPLTNNILGYSTFPNEPGASAEQGVVIDYRSLPRGSFSNYSMGKTLPHETGHYFNLYHIWGDDQGDCTGTDYVDDTPNQADASKSCIVGIKTDACTPDSNGIMYENYMDYTYDSCLVMFTRQQVVRMESALTTYRASLLSSNACTPPVIKNFDARLTSIDQPSQRLCTSLISPVVTIQNNGSQTLTSLDISTRIDSGTISTFKWTGSLAYLASTPVNLSAINTTPGNHVLNIYVANPNNNADETITNDTISASIQFYTPVTSVSESFEGDTFPPSGWDIVNPDNSITWKKVSSVSKTGASSVMIENYNYNVIGSKDDLRLPTVSLQNADSAFLSFQVAAAAYSNGNTNSNVWDTLQVLVSTDCGQTYTSLYKKYGTDLITRPGSTTYAFVPTASEWRKDSINLENYLGQNNLLFSIRNTTGYENNIYLDDINVRPVFINPNLKRLGFLATPNPTTDAILVQFYPQPNTLRALQVYNISGQKLIEVAIQNGQANNSYSIDLTRFAAGTYILRAVFNDRVITKKILKL